MHKFIEINNSVVNADQIVELFLESGGEKRTLLRFKDNSNWVEVVNFTFEELKKILLNLHRCDDPPTYESVVDDGHS